MRNLRIFLSHRVKYLPLLTLIAWVCNLASMCWSERYKAFLAPAFLPWLMVGTVILALFIYALLSRSDAAKSADPYRDLGHAAIILLPLAFCQSYQEGGLSSYDVDKQFSTAMAGTAGGQPIAKASPNPEAGKGAAEVQPAAPAKSSTEVTLAQIVFSANTLNGQKVVTEGAVYRGSRMLPGYFILYRFWVMCCAADARPLGIFIPDKQATTLPNDCWVKVEGIVRLKDFNGRTGMCIEPEKIERRPPPKDRYLY